MDDPFAVWSRLFAAALDVAQTGARAAETAAGAYDVIVARSAVIGDAIQSPATADHAELARMLPEKIAAMSLSGAAVIGGLAAMQAAMLTEMMHVGAMAMRGRLPSPAEVDTLARRNAEYLVVTVERASALAADALAPIHARVRSNARRLGRKPR